jgi:hypothetical protein
MNSKNWIEKLQLISHPEGGYYSEIYRSEGIIPQVSLPFRYNGGRVYSTTIYYLLETGDFSSLHRLDSDEQWFHLDGSALIIHSIDPDGKYEKHPVGKNIEKGESLFAVIPHGSWFGATVDDPNTFALVGCVVAPGFDFEDFELAKRDELIEQFPQHSEIFKQLTRI